MGMRWLAAIIFLMLSLTGLGAISAHGPILIHSVEDLYGLASGFGTAASPFVIENLRVDANGEPFGILITNVSCPLILRNLEVYGASVAAIRVQNVKNLVMENLMIRGSLAGILVGGSQNITIKKVRVENCADGVRLMFSETITITEIAVEKAEVGIWFQGVTSSTLKESVIQECGIGLILELGSSGNLVAGNAFLANHVHAQSCGSNQFDDGQRGNFWEGFSAKDANSDGIWDESYPVGLDVDRFPLVSRP
jgi:nitrous oxidase accessory protein NosD